MIVINVLIEVDNSMSCIICFKLIEEFSFVLLIILLIKKVCSKFDVFEISNIIFIIDRVIVIFFKCILVNWIL